MSRPRHLPLRSLHALFMEVIYPCVHKHARIYFRHVPCPDQRADRIAECIGLAWKWFVRLVHKGQDARRYAVSLARYATRAVHSGRRVVGQERAVDVLSPVPQQRHHFAVGKLPDFSTLGGNPLAEALHDNTLSPVPDQVAFRLDFPAWLVTLGRRNRDLVEDMALGHRTRELARKYHVSAGRISQLRRFFQCDWTLFCTDNWEDDLPAGRA